MDVTPGSCDSGLRPTRRMTGLAGLRPTCRIVGTLIALLTALLLAAPAAQAADAPEPVTTWLAEDGIATIVADPNIPNLEEETLSLGAPVQAWTWSESYLMGGAGEPLIETDRWVSPVTVSVAEDDEPREEISGGLIVDVTEGAVTHSAVIWTSRFGRAAVASSTELVFDNSLNAWFSLVDGEVRPLTDEALAVLAGPMPIASIQDYVRDWNGTLEARETPEPAPEVDSSRVVMTAALVIVSVLVLVATTVAVRKERERR
ncbi:hypothetical protein SAMN06298212_101131 [Ruaniaceae bacterium KH17]|nr:hypothetical protein SAMN06298212_101131 [Ruaniaceae bacterium KH17]